MVLVGMGITALWSVATVYLFSTGEVTSADLPGVSGGILKKVELNQDARYALIYHVFGFFWSTQFLVALTEITIAFVACTWFFAPRKANNARELPTWPTFAALGTVFRFHLGSVAFGSAVIAIIKFIRACIEFVEYRLRKARQDSQMVRAVLCCCRCCFWCLEKCMRFINRNAYIMIALTKQSFCGAASSAFSAIMGNLARVGALSAVSTLFLFFGRLFVAGGSAGIAYIVFTKMDKYADPTSDSAVSAPFIPTMIVFLLAYIIGALFMAIYDVTIDSMLMCYIFDETHHLLDEDTKKNLKALNDQCATALSYQAPLKGGSGSGAAKGDAGAAARPDYSGAQK